MSDEPWAPYHCIYGCTGLSFDTVAEMCAHMDEHHPLAKED